MQMDGSRLTDRVAAQAGRDFPGPGPRCSLERGTRCARVGRGPFFVFGPDRGLARGSHCVRAGRGPFFVFGLDRGLAHGSHYSRVGCEPVFVFRPDSSYEQ
jgi:hypothetical protein